MQKIIARWQLLISGLILVIAASGCFQSAGTDADFQSVPVNPGATFTLPPTDTPLPLPTDIPLATATQSGIASLSNPTVTLPFSNPTQDTGVVVQVLPTQELFPVDMTATAFIIKATTDIQTQEYATLVGAGVITPIPTWTPFGQGVTPDFVTSAPTTFGTDCIHEVRAGERLFRIALTYGVTVEDIVARTGGITNPNILSIGQKLVIPGCGTTGAFPPATSTFTPAPGFVTPIDNGTGVIATPIPSFGGTTYVVRQGDTLFQLSLQYGVPIASIMAANPTITDMNSIYISQEIIIPAQ
ncbi:MAG: LysM peptidoglycan-binding domain-containing protein [Anaerolineaceae bacterium]|nr:LysM peptidoglycan-binding domain-containing protein [Anaerolineaceae bacterium]